jgi:hypothetical protein
MAKNQAPSDEAQAKRLEKAADFKRLAEKRVVKALSVLRSIGALSNKSAYVYDTTQVAKIVDALKAGVNGVNAAFEKPDAAGGPGFTL